MPVGRNRPRLATFAVILAVVTGCGSAGVPEGRELPPVNAAFAARTVREALDGAGVPLGDGTVVSLAVTGNHAATFEPSVITFLSRHGYVVTGDVPEQVHVVLDSLNVVLREHRSLFGGGTIDRRAAARVTVTREDAAGASRTWWGRAEISDRLPLSDMIAVTDGSGFATVIPDERFGEAVLKPLIAGVVMTALAWLLYSYRG